MGWQTIPIIITDQGVKTQLHMIQLDPLRDPRSTSGSSEDFRNYYDLEGVTEALGENLISSSWKNTTYTSTIYTFVNGAYELKLWTADGGSNIQYRIYRASDNLLIAHATLSKYNDFTTGQYSGFLFWYNTDIDSYDFGEFHNYKTVDDYIYYATDSGTVDNMTAFIEMMNGIQPEEDEPYQFVGDDNEDDSGYGDFDYSGDDDDFTSLPTISASGTGLCNLFKLSRTDISDLASYLWGLGSIASFLPVFNNPMDCILSLGIVPVDPSAGTRDYIKVGNLTTTAQGAPISNQFIAQDMGKVTIGKGKFSNSFMDYSPYTKAELYLPYIGTVTLDIDEIMDSTLYLNYNIDLLSGAAVAELKVVKNYKYQGASHTHSNILYSYSGNVLTNIPITGQNFTQMFQAIVGAVATGIGGNASGAITKNPTMQNAIQQQTVASEISSSSAMKPDIKRGGNIASSCGMMSKQKAKVILSLPKLCMTDKQGQEVGYPRYNRYQLKSLKGYTKIFEIHLTGIPCTDAERRMIQSVLTGGVIISKTSVPTQTAGNNTVLIYSQKCEDIELNKADNWTLLDTISGNWRDESIDILVPKIRLEATSNLTYANIMKKANYVYIGDFGRYYYINKINAMSGNVFEVELSVDAPMSWLSDVLDQYAIVDRQQNSWNVYLSDSFIRTYNTPYTTVLDFDKGFTTHNFILAVAGG